MAWPERCGLGVFVLFGLFLWVATGPDVTSLPAFLGFCAVVASVAWVVLRTIDFMIGGPQRRKARRHSQLSAH